MRQFVFMIKLELVKCYSKYGSICFGVKLIAESVESAESALMQYSNCWKSAIRQFTVTE